MPKLWREFGVQLDSGLQTQIAALSVHGGRDADAAARAPPFKPELGIDGANHSAREPIPTLASSPFVGICEEKGLKNARVSVESSVARATPLQSETTSERTQPLLVDGFGASWLMFKL